MKNTRRWPLRCARVRRNGFGRQSRAHERRASVRADARGRPHERLPKLWARMAKVGKLPTDLTPHVLRHSFASLAGDLGYSEPTLAALIGHKGHSITSRYVHAADAVLLAAADAVANRTAELMGETRASGDVISLRGKPRAEPPPNVVNRLSGAGSGAPHDNVPAMGLRGRVGRQFKRWTAGLGAGVGAPWVTSLCVFEGCQICLGFNRENRAINAYCNGYGMVRGREGEALSHCCLGHARRLS